MAPRWRGDRAVEGNGLENRRAGNGTVGSNPTLSAIYGTIYFIRRGTQEAEGGSLLNC